MEHALEEVGRQWRRGSSPHHSPPPETVPCEDDEAKGTAQSEQPPRNHRGWGISLNPCRKDQHEDAEESVLREPEGAHESTAHDLWLSACLTHPNECRAFSDCARREPSAPRTHTGQVI